MNQNQLKHHKIIRTVVFSHGSVVGRRPSPWALPDPSVWQHRSMVKSAIPKDAWIMKPLNNIALLPFLRYHSIQIPFVKKRLAIFLKPFQLCHMFIFILSKRLQVEELVLVRDYKGRQRNSRVNPGFLGKDLVQSKERVHFGKWFLDFFCIYNIRCDVLMYDRWIKKLMNFLREEW